MSRILVSSGALIGRPNGRDYRKLKDIMPKLKYDGLEFMVYSDWYGKIDEVSKFLNSLNIDIPVVHCQKTVGELITAGDNEKAIDHFKQNCQLAKNVGAGKMVIHLWNGEISDSNFENNLNMYGTIREIANDYGVNLLVENVLCNVKNPMERWKELLNRYNDAHLIFDTKMADFHGQLDDLYKEENDFLYKENHICHYHVNDYGGGYMTWDNLKVLPIGKGHIDFDKFFKFIKKTGYDDTFTVEATAFSKDGSVDTDMLNECFDRIRDYML